MIAGTARRAPFAVFSGLDGAGKSTQIALLTQSLSCGRNDPRVLWTRVGYTPGVNTLKALLRRSAGQRLPGPGHSSERDGLMARPLIRKTWIALSIVELTVIYAIGIRWLLWTGTPVVCDRYIVDSSLDLTLNFPDEKAERWMLWRLLETIAPVPNVAILMLVPVAESMRRSDKKGEPYRDDRETLARRLALYRSRSEDDWLVLDGRDSIDALAVRIATALERAIIARGHRRRAA